MIADKLLDKTAMMLSNLIGWDFPPGRWNDLDRGIAATAKDLGIKSTPEAISTWLTSTLWDEKELELLASHLMVGETYFFREKAGLEVFQTQIIPELIKERQGKDQYLRIWCAGCCTGEEPYTLAMILKEIIPDLDNWSITLLATDINRNFLKKARTGVYTSWSFRETQQTAINRYFSKVGQHWQINSEIKEMVSFEFLNLAEDQYPSAKSNTENMDVIFCRNVLMYFTPHQIRQVASRFHQSLTENGWLLTSAVEMNDDFFPAFTAVRLEQGIFYRKVPATATIPAIADVPGPKPGEKNIIKFRKGSVYQDKHTRSTVTGKPAAPCTTIIKKTESPDLGEIRVLFNRKQYKPCIDNCLLWLAARNPDREIYTMLVKSQANMGNLSEAKLWGEKLLLLDRPGADEYYLMSAIQMEDHHPEQAESTLKRALYIDPHHLLSHFLMGNIAQRQGKTSVAGKHFQNVKDLLVNFRDNDILPGSDGITAGQIKKIVSSPPAAALGWNLSATHER